MPCCSYPNTCKWTLDALWGPEEACEVFTFEPYYGGDLHRLLDILVDNIYFFNATISMTTIQWQSVGIKFVFYTKISKILGITKSGGEGNRVHFPRYNEHMRGH